jgi:ABC-2 type transport system ATP-binding protein
VGSLPRDLRRRVALAQACISHPPVLLLDEPTHGLRPEERERVLCLLASSGNEGLVILATPDWADVEAVADTVAVLDRGRLRYFGAPADLSAHLPRRVWTVPFPPGSDPALQAGFLTTGVRRSTGGHVIRGISEEAPLEGACLAEPTAKDAYLWLISKEEG